MAAHNETPLLTLLFLIVCHASHLAEDPPFAYPTANPTRSITTPDRYTGVFSKYVPRALAAQEVWAVRQAPSYVGMEEVLAQELPFCVVWAGEGEVAGALGQEGLVYGNYYLVEMVSGHEEKSMEHWGHRVLKLARERCSEHSVIVPIQNTLQPQALRLLNRIYQTTRTWSTYHQYGVSSFHPSILEAALTKFNPTLSQPTSLCSKFSQLSELMVQISGIQSTYFPTWAAYESAPAPGSCSLTHVPIQPAYLQQSPLYHLNSLAEHHNLTKYQQRTLKLLNQESQMYMPREGITHEMMLQAIENVDMKLWSAQHALHHRQAAIYQSKYGLPIGEEVHGDIRQHLGRIPTKVREETRFCVVVLSNNNAQNSRYQNALTTILRQQYSNYHIVFIDDASDDGTLELTQQAYRQYYRQRNRDRQLRQEKFRSPLPEESMVPIALIRNQDRKYASHNIKDAVDNHCRQEEVLLLVDGDDELIGTRVFALINLHYVRHPEAWVVYTNNFSNRLHYGGSKTPSPQFFSGSQRAFFHLATPVRTYRVQVLRKIKLQDFQDEEGQYLDTFYDDALQYPVFEMAGLQRIVYVPEICYYYVADTGNNDSSSKDKIAHRLRIRQQILKRPRYQPLATLQ